MGRGRVRRRQCISPRRCISRQCTWQRRCISRQCTWQRRCISQEPRQEQCVSPRRRRAARQHDSSWPRRAKWYAHAKEEEDSRVSVRIYARVPRRTRRCRRVLLEAAGLRCLAGRELFLRTILRSCCVSCGGASSRGASSGGSFRRSGGSFRRSGSASSGGTSSGGSFRRRCSECTPRCPSSSVRPLSTKRRRVRSAFSELHKRNTPSRPSASVRATGGIPK